MASTLCAQPVGLSKNGTDRGTCARPRGHRGRHANRTCALCAVPTPRHATYCRECSRQFSQNYRVSEAKAVTETVARLYEERLQLEAVAGPLLVEKLLNRICAEQSAI